MMLLEEINNNNPILIHSSDCILDKYSKIEIGDSDVIVFTKKNYRRGFKK